MTPLRTRIANTKMALAFSRWWSITALVLSLAMLGTAWSFQLFGHLNPCHLCLKQRDIYWMAVGVSLVASVWALFVGAKGPPRVFSFVLFAIFATGAALALFHAGVEWKWWPGPTACTGTGGDLSFGDLSSGNIEKVIPCDQVQWRDPIIQFSLAGYNALLSLLDVVLLLAAIVVQARRRRA